MLKSAHQLGFLVETCPNDQVGKQNQNQTWELKEEQLSEMLKRELDATRLSSLCYALLVP